MRHKRTFGIIEIIFDVLYLAAVFLLGIYIFMHAQNVMQKLYGVMALVLAGGDAFHLIPRIILALRQEKGSMEGALGIGKMITSVGMTFFYLILWIIGVLNFSPRQIAPLTIVAAALFLIRVVMILLPQNGWKEVKQDRWNIYRNVPFVCLGGMTGLLYWNFRDYGNASFEWMWLAILISFLCYLPVVLWVKRYPMLGMLMLPKSCAYIWIITMGVGFIGGQ